MTLEQFDTERHLRERGRGVAGTHRYAGMERVNRALRWMSTAALTEGNKVEVQSTVHSGKLVMSSNKESGTIAQSVNTALRRDPREFGGRQQRHLANIHRHLLDDEGYTKYRAKMVEEIRRNEGMRPGGLGNDDAERQGGAMLDAVRHAASRLRSTAGTSSVHVVGNDGPPMHAEQAIYEDIANRRDQVARATRESMGYDEGSRTKLVLPVSGGKRPCALCNEVEHIAQDRPGLFGEESEFGLLRTSTRPGILYRGHQRLALNAMNRPHGEHITDQIARSVRDDTLRASRQPQLFHDDTDSEPDDER